MEMLETKSSIEHVNSEIEVSFYRSLKNAQKLTEFVKTEIAECAKNSDLADAIFNADEKIGNFKDKLESDMLQFQEINEGMSQF